MKLAKPATSFRLLGLLALVISICIMTLLVSMLMLILRPVDSLDVSSSSSWKPTTPEHIAFGIASSKRSWPHRKDFVKLWWDHRRMRGCVFLEEPLENYHKFSADSAYLPPVCVSGDISRFRYTYKNGLRSAIRLARIVKETVDLNLPGVRWYVFGDDDTVFFPENLAKVLSKYNHELWYYIGENSEIYEQNLLHSFGTAYGGGGFAISSSLAKVLSKVLDSCLERYPHEYGSDGRIASCVAELGVGLTKEPGFHQMDIRGNIFGILASHPLTPLVSLHHLGHAAPIFPNMSHLGALQHLFLAVKANSERVVQQTVCYDHSLKWTISVSWGYAVQVFDRHVYLPDALRAQETFVKWKKKGDRLSYAYMFDTSPLHVDPCRRSTVFFLDGVDTTRRGLYRSRYRRMAPDKCTFDPKVSPKKLEEVVVFSPKLNLGVEQLQAPRRQCCDTLRPTRDNKMEIYIRECKRDELIYMHP